MEKEVTQETESTEVTKADEKPATSAPSRASELEMLMKTVSTLTEEVRRAGKHATSEGPRSEDREKMERMSADVEKLQKSLDTVLNQRNTRKAEFDVSEIETPSLAPSQIKTMIKSRVAPEGSIVDEIQRANDDTYIAMKAMRLSSPKDSERLMDYLKGNYPAYYKAMQTTTGQGVGEHWIPTGFSSRLIEDVRLTLRVANLHDRFNMPTNPYTFPVEGADISAYKVGENTGDDDAGTPATWIPAATPTTSNLTFSAKKIGVRVVTSNEFIEDSIIAALPYMRSRIVLSLGEAQENILINGDVRVDGTGVDGLTAGQSSDQRTAWNGYRRFCVDNGNVVDAAGLTLADIRAVRTKMGKYGVNNSQLALVTGINAYNQLLSLDQVITIDKFGPRATILSGQIGAIDGIPIIISEFVRENYGAGLTGSGSTTAMFLVRRDLFWFGDRRDIQIKGREVIETDQNVLVALQRLDFKPLLTPSSTVIPVCAGRNIALV